MISELIQNSKWSIKNELLDSIRQALFVIPDSEQPDSQEVGASRYGGLPDMSQFTLDSG